MCRRYAREGKTDRAFCILFIAPPEPALRRLWNSATVVSSPSRTTCQRRDTNQYIRMVTKKPRFIAETTSQTAQKACFAAPSGSKKKPLEKYHPWAARSRPKQFTENVVGRRFGFTSTSETYRGSSQISLGDESVKNTFQTTNRAFQRVSVASRASKEKSVSMTTNQGIASDVARRLHATLIPKPPLETTF